MQKILQLGGNKLFSSSVQKSVQVLSQNWGLLLEGHNTLAACMYLVPYCSSYQGQEMLAAARTNTKMSGGI